MLTTRLLTAIVLIPIVAWLMYLGGLPFFALVAVLATVAQIEFSRLIARSGVRAVHLFGIGVVWLCLLDGQYPERQLLTRGIAAMLLLSLSWQVLRFGHSTVREWAGAIATGLYVGLCGSYLIRLRGLPDDGLWWTFIVVPVTFFADAVAYFVGSIWGRRRLAPRLSSGKTLEGYIGAVLLSGLMGALLGLIWNPKAGPETTVTWSRALILSGLIAALAPMGDLAISMVKREAGADNTSNLLPGHGGVLDRLDTILFAAVIAHAFVVWFAR